MSRLVEKVVLPIFGEMYIANADEVSLESTQALQEIFKKLYDYEDAEEQDLLLRFPCRIGDIVYEIAERCSHPNDCGFDCEFCSDNQADIFPTEFTIDMIKEVGETVFLTREEAEQKLKEMEAEAK